MEKRFSDVLKSEKFWIAIGAIIAILASAAVPALASSEADLIEAFKTIAVVAILGGSVVEALQALYPIVLRIVQRTPDKRDDYALAAASAILAALGIDLEPSEVTVETPDGGSVTTTLSVD